MSTKNELSRITIDMQVLKHKKLKAIAALSGKSMREMVLEFIDHGLMHYEEEGCDLSHVPNKETIQAIRDSKKKSNLVKAKDAKDLFKKLGL